jgi:hypothetical protein
MQDRYFNTRKFSRMTNCGDEILILEINLAVFYSPNNDTG